MIRRLLVPLDGSPHSESIVPTALSLAKATGGGIHIGYVLHRPSERTYDRDSEKYQEADIYLSDWENRIEAEGVPVIKNVLYGEPAEEIVNYARDKSIDLITMATHGRNARERLLSGSVTDEVIRHSMVPVLGWRIPDEDESPRNIQFKRILVPLDGSETSEKILPYAASLARQIEASLHLLRVITDVPEPDVSPADDRDYDARLMEGELREARHYLDQYREQYALSDLQVTTEAEYGTPEEMILMVAESRKADLIAMSTHGRSGIQRAILGSITTAVLNESPIPVMTRSAAAPEPVTEKDGIFLGSGESRAS